MSNVTIIFNKYLLKIYKIYLHIKLVDWNNLVIKQPMRKLFGFMKSNHQLLPLTYKFKLKIFKYITYFMPWLINMPSATISYNKIDKRSLLSQDFLGSLDDFFGKNSKTHLNADICVSVIIPVFGKIEYTLNCLKSIMCNPPEATFELVIIDDCSHDETFDVLSKINGIRVLRNKENMGFIRSCNRGAEAAVGRYLYFLNNDTEVRAGWLDRLVETFANFANVGLVGSKLIYSDGRLQEAGGVVWKDASAWNFGRLSDPNHPLYNYAREVSYCSGASILVPKDLFEKVGRFDEVYLPAYYEDVDLAFSIRSKGYKVIYQPLSEIIHHEGITSGTDLSAGIKKYQVINQKIFASKWKSELSKYQNNGEDVEKAIDRSAKFNVLVIDSITPSPQKDAGSLLILNLLLILRALKFKISFLPNSNYANVGEDTAKLQGLGIKTLFYPYYKNIEDIYKSDHSYDLVILVRPSIFTDCFHISKKYFKNAKTIYHTIDLHYERMRKEAELKKSKNLIKQSEEIKKIELEAIESADASIVVSTSELAALRELINVDNVRVVPLILKENKFEIGGYQARTDLMFVGSFGHPPNEDAVLYFINDIFPLVKDKIPGIKFHVIGANPPDSILKLQSNDVIIHGFVDDLEEFMGRRRISVAPQDLGQASRGK